MTDAKIAVYARLSADTATKALVSTRIYAYMAPSGTIEPFIVFSQAEDTENWMTLTTQSAEVSSWSVRCVGATWASAYAVASAATAALDVPAGGTWGGVVVKSCRVGSSSEEMVDLQNGSVVGAPSVSLQARIII